MKPRLVLSLAISLLLTVPAFASSEYVLFDDGPTNGQYISFYIDGPNPGPFNQYISNGFVATNTGTASSLVFGLWVPGGTVPISVSWWLGTSAFAGDLGSATVNNPSYSYFGSNADGYDVYNVTIAGLSGQINAGQTYWLSLGNVNDSGGTQYDRWDVNLGPATCNYWQSGTAYGDCGYGGEAFTLYGTSEPGTLILLGGGLLAAVGGLRHKIGL